MPIRARYQRHPALSVHKKAGPPESDHHHTSKNFRLVVFKKEAPDFLNSQIGDFKWQNNF